MNLTENLELTFSFPEMNGITVQVSQNGEDQARNNVIRYNTSCFDQILSVIN